MSTIRVAIVGVGNCASSLIQGVEYYKDADPSTQVPGLMHVQFGPYHVRDLEFVTLGVGRRRREETATPPPLVLFPCQAREMREASSTCSGVGRTPV